MAAGLHHRDDCGQLTLALRLGAIHERNLPLPVIEKSPAKRIGLRTLEPNLLRQFLQLNPNTNGINSVTSHCEPEALHRPEPIRFGAPHDVQGEGRGNLIFIGIASSLRSSQRHLSYCVCIS
jgi:hypothetical protein